MWDAPELLDADGEDGAEVASVPDLPGLLDTLLRFCLWPSGDGRSPARCLPSVATLGCLMGCDAPRAARAVAELRLPNPAESTWVSK